MNNQQTNNQDHKDYIVFSQNMAGKLMQNGFKLLNMKPSNKKGSNRNIFVFRESNELINFIHTNSNNSK